MSGLPSTQFRVSTELNVLASMPLTAVVPESPLTWPTAKRIDATSVTPGTSWTVEMTSTGIGEKPSWFWTTSAALT